MAYGIDDAFQNRGFAKEMARAFTEYALTQPSVRKVVARTLPTNGPSHRVLTKCGFQNTGTHQDPDDGLVWRWEFTR